MRRLSRIVGALCLLFATMTVVGQEAQAYPPQKLAHWGPVQSLGNGQVQTLFLETPSGKPVAIGVAFDGDALTGLPTSFSDGKWSYDGHSCCGHEHVLDFPDEVVQSTPFEWMMLNWNPQGHVPPGVYDIPHFDFHFYRQPYQERFDIKAGTCAAAPPGVLIDCPSFQKGMQPLPPKMQPDGFTNIGAVEAGMGAHLIDLSGPEWNGERFTHTYIWGAWEGEITFQEPMITVEFFERQHAEVCTPYAAPEVMPEAGWYPTNYCIRYDRKSDRHFVTLEDFEWIKKAGTSGKGGPKGK